MPVLVLVGGGVVVVPVLVPAGGRITIGGHRRCGVVAVVIGGAVVVAGGAVVVAGGAVVVAVGGTRGGGGVVPVPVEVVVVGGFAVDVDGGFAVEVVVGGGVTAGGVVSAVAMSPAVSIGGVNPGSSVVFPVGVTSTTGGVSTLMSGGSLSVEAERARTT